MKKRIIALLLILPVLFLTGCKTPSVSKNSDFILTLHTDKERYSDGETIACYATVRYTGDADNLTVYTDEPEVTFILSKNVFDITGGASLLILKEAEFKKDETKDYPFVKSGGYDENSPEWVKELYNSEELTLHKGVYTIIAMFSYSYTTEGDSETLTVSKAIFVK